MVDKANQTASRMLNASMILLKVLMYLLNELGSTKSIDDSARLESLELLEINASIKICSMSNLAKFLGLPTQVSGVQYPMRPIFMYDGILEISDDMDGKTLVETMEERSSSMKSSDLMTAMFLMHPIKARMTRADMAAEKNILNMMKFFGFLDSLTLKIK